MSTSTDQALIVYARLVDEAEGVPPSLRELAAELGLASAYSGNYWAKRLIAAGYLHTPPALARRNARDRSYTVTVAGRRRLAQLRVSPERMAGIGD